MDMYDDEDGVKALVAYCEEVVREVADYYIEAGCDIIAAVDPLVSQISPDMFECVASFRPCRASTVLPFLKM